MRETKKRNRMRRSVRDICSAFRKAGVEAEVRGNEELEVEIVSTPHEIADRSADFVERPRDIPSAVRSSASLVVLPLGAFSELISTSAVSDRALIGVSDVRKAMPVLLNLFNRRRVPAAGIHSTAVIGKKTVLGKNVSIGPYVVIGGDCVIGDGAMVESHVSIGNGSSVGSEKIGRAHV